MLAKNVETTRVFKQPAFSLASIASMLAKNDETTRAFRQPALSLTSIASKLRSYTGPC